MTQPLTDDAHGDLLTGTGTRPPMGWGALLADIGLTAPGATLVPPAMVPPPPCLDGLDDEPTWVQHLLRAWVTAVASRYPRRAAHLHAPKGYDTGARRDALDAMARQAIVAGMDDAAGGEAFRFELGLGALRGMLAPMVGTCDPGRPGAPRPGEAEGGSGGDAPGPSAPSGGGGRGLVVLALGALAAASALGVGWWMTRGPGSLGPGATRPNPGAGLDAGVDHARAAVRAWGDAHVRNNTVRATPRELAELRSQWVSYEGHFKHANSFGLRQQFHLRFPWLEAATRKRRFHLSAEGRHIEIRLSERAT